MFYQYDVVPVHVPQALICVRGTNTRLYMTSFVASNCTVIAVGEEAPDKAYDFIFLMFEPATPRELSWYHNELRPRVKQGTSFIECGSAR